MSFQIDERVAKWLSGPYDAETKATILRLQKTDPNALKDAFYRDLSFGTGGMRGIMGVGTNRINIYTVRTASQGFANYLLQIPQETKRRIFIGYDTRLHSRLFAEETARVFAGNGIEAFITIELCPTPLVSFGCRYYACSGAVMITASHNPPEYNGYKVYWKDGAQVVLPHDEGIISKVRSAKEILLDKLSSPLIHWIGDGIDEAYLEQQSKMQYLKHPKLQIVYTNLHGTGLRLVPKALSRFGFPEVRLVKAQMGFDPKFSAALSPNPEEGKALALGAEELLKERADLLLATDPDADRLGACVREKEKAIQLSGNEIACLCLNYLLNSLQVNGELPENGAVIKTIVTTELFSKIAAKFQIQCFDVLTGFKYIAELIHEWEESFGGYQFLFGAEESHGYLAGTFVRDKDAISASCLLASAAEEARRENRTLIDRLYEIYRIYGVHRQSVSSIVFEDSLSGMEEMAKLLAHLRANPPHTILEKKVVRIEDYLSKMALDLESGKKEELLLPVSDVLRFWLEDETKIVIRPSGTEPKIKIYAEGCLPPTPKIDESIRQCDSMLSALLDAFKATLNLSFDN